MSTPTDALNVAGPVEALRAAPMSDYSPSVQAFYNFWYGHMLNDLMQPPLCGISHSTAQYVWQAALASSPAAGTPEMVQNQPALRTRKHSGEVYGQAIPAAGTPVLAGATDLPGTP